MYDILSIAAYLTLELRKSPAAERFRQIRRLSFERFLELHNKWRDLSIHGNFNDCLDRREERRQFIDLRLQLDKKLNGLHQDGFDLNLKGCQSQGITPFKLATNQISIVSAKLYNGSLYLSMLFLERTESCLRIVGAFNRNFDYVRGRGKTSPCAL